MKVLKLVFFLAGLFFLLPRAVFADENFDISTTAIYEILPDNSAKVTKNISILNKKEFIFSPNYNISFGFEDIKNIQIFNSFGSIPFDYEKEGGNVNLNINFNNPPKGVNSVNSFTISFVTNELVEKKGDVFEVDIPGLSDPQSFTKYDTRIIVPESYPEIGIIKPNLTEKKKDLIFSKEETKGAGIVLIFGQEQYYDLVLNYNIVNPNLFPITTEIALPMDTNYQKVLIESLSENPNKVKVDNDGNWLAQYYLLPREKKTITAKVKVKQASVPEKVKITESEIKKYTTSDEFWEANDKEIRKNAQELKTPERIYEFVVNSLTYDYEKVSSDDERLGAKGSLNNSKNAVCLEYSDLLVALLRSAGIPARSIEGFAYTKNTRLRPVALSDDILHAWVQYYNFEKEAWIMVDPTWGSTTRGIDYFSNLDLDHIAFVIKGEESNYPIPAGGYKFENSSKDIKVTFSSKNEFNIKNSLEISDSFPKFSLSGIPISGFVTIKNTGNSFINSKKVTVTNLTTGQIKEYEVKNLPPYGTETFVVTFDTSFLTNSNHEIKIQVDKGEKLTNVRVSFIPDLNLILLGGGIFVASALVTWFAVKTGRVYLQRRKR